MNIDACKLLVGISKHIITLSVAIIAGLMSLIGILKPQLHDLFLAAISISASGLAVVFGILLQTSITSIVMEEKSRIPSNPKLFYSLTWLLFILSGLFAFFFLLSNM